MKTHLQKLRDLRHGIFQDTATVNALLDECIKEAETMVDVADVEEVLGDSITTQQAELVMRRLRHYLERL